MFKQTQPDIVSICVPDGQHFLILKKIIKYKPKLVICEKPITTKIVDTEKIIKLYKKNKISVLVNYSRRFDVVIQQLKKDLSENKYGRVVSASGIYSKGILHNGSHLIDLASFLFGKIK
ncbi:MAG: Gfo/Idh/MocA family oxidoreductase, partial [Candidatus Staskawiczbacteria bacterium]|nr:Gfo/Idh/MocA family oxidoreductase [Candidatus Staskawiczbacteria bacterium]